MRIKGTFLGSAVGRRIFALFLVATTVPIALLSLGTYRGISDLLNRHARAELSSYSKTYGMEVVGRLKAAQVALERFAVEIPRLPVGSSASTADDSPMFRSLAVFGADAGPMRSGAGAAVPAQVLAELSAKTAREAPLAGDEAIIAVPGGAAADNVLAMVGYVHPKGAAVRKVVAVLDPSYVFGNGDGLAAQTDACVFAGPGSIPLYCSNWRALAPAQAAAAGRLAHDAAAETMDVGRWTLLASPRLNTEAWAFISMRAVEYGALADREIGATYIKVALACVVLVALMSLVQIRRILVPLERLMDATRRLAAWDFSHPIPIEGRDEFSRLAASFNDMAKTVENQIGALKTLSTIDSLTGLPNRLQAHEVIEKMLAGGAQQAEPFAVLFIDLDRFKGVNDGMGHDAGDALLIQAARRIRGCLRDEDLAARLGGDEFVVLTTRITPAGAPERLARDLIAAVSAPFRIGVAEVYLSASIGIALAPKDGASREALIRNADTAMYRAKAQGRGRPVLFDESMSRAAIEILSLEKDLRSAVHRSEIAVHYQPRVKLSDGSVVGAEALARWQHASRGAVPPAQFIALAEDIGLIETLGESVLSQACALLAARARRANASCPLSVNLSALQLRNPEVCRRLLRIVESFGQKPELIELEVTESVLVDDMQTTCATLERLRSAGFRIALDDFGTGQSSLSYLHSLPIDVMKIDQSFVCNIVSSPSSRAIAVAIIAMARTLGIRVVAEGVETDDQALMLREWGCEEAQGFLYSRPLQVEDFDRFMAAHTSDVACAT